MTTFILASFVSYGSCTTRWSASCVIDDYANFNCFRNIKHFLRITVSNIHALPGKACVDIYQQSNRATCNYQSLYLL